MVAEGLGFLGDLTFFTGLDFFFGLVFSVVGSRLRSTPGLSPKDLREGAAELSFLTTFNVANLDMFPYMLFLSGSR